jgi:hypothetical protein
VAARSHVRPSRVTIRRPRTGQTTGVIPETRYAKSSDGTYLAYQEFGEGDQDLLWVPGFATHLEVY